MLIKSLMKFVFNIAKNWNSKLSPNIQMKTLIKTKYNLWDGTLIKILQVAIYFSW